MQSRNLVSDIISVEYIPTDNLFNHYKSHQNAFDLTCRPFLIYLTVGVPPPDLLRSLCVFNIITKPCPCLPRDHCSVETWTEVCTSGYLVWIYIYIGSYKSCMWYIRSLVLLTPFSGLSRSSLWKRSMLFIRSTLGNKISRYFIDIYHYHYNFVTFWWKIKECHHHKSWWWYGNKPLTSV